ncbi:hypothetical protein TNCV_204911 [Trichonephila clavipes]|nr:hypothetical protein TNCV_204911 [Trichonephila clavipes]
MHQGNCIFEHLSEGTSGNVAAPDEVDVLVENENEEGTLNTVSDSLLNEMAYSWIFMLELYFMAIGRAAAGQWAELRSLELGFLKFFGEGNSAKRESSYWLLNGQEFSCVVFS